MERQKVDCAHHDFLGNRYSADWFCSYGRAVLYGPLSTGCCRVQFLPGHDRLFDSLVPHARAWPGHRLSICSSSRLLANRLAPGGVAAWSALAVAGGVALALYSGRDPCDPPGDHYHLL